MGKQIQVGGLPVGGGAPVSIQSMTNTPTHDVEATVAQIRRLAAAGCQIVRVAVPNLAAAKAVGKIKEAIDLPLVVDIHFDYRLALECVEAGADKVRINPGNIGGADRVKAVARACARRNIPIRIGVNGGSLEKPILAKYGGVTTRPWWTPPLATSPCSTGTTLTTSASPSNPPRSPSPWGPMS